MSRLIETSVDIGAAPSRVWEILTDFPRYSEWNPFIRSIEGRGETGERLSISVAPPGGREVRFKPRILLSEPAIELRWLGHLIFPGLFDGEHYFRLEPRGDGTCFRHGEDFRGLLPALMSDASFAPIRAGMEGMNHALKQRAES